MVTTPRSETPTEVLGRARTESLSPSILTFPRDMPPHSMVMIFRKYNYTTPGETGLLNFDNNTVPNMRLAGLSGIELPFPTNLRDVDSLRVERFEQGFFEGLLGGYAADIYSGTQQANFTIGEIPGKLQNFGASLANVNLSNVGDSVVNALNGVIGGALSSSAADVARDAAFLLRTQLPNNLQRVSDAIIGNTVNPKAALTFEGVELKPHSFTWTLAPKSVGDSDTLNSIIRMIKTNSLPSYQSVTGTSFKAYLSYPSIVDIYLMGVNREYFMKFKPAMIRSVNVDYGSSGLVSIVRGGKPAMVTLSLDLIEMDIHTANDYTGTIPETTTDSVEAVDPVTSGITTSYLDAPDVTYTTGDLETDRIITRAQAAIDNAGG